MDLPVLLGVLGTILGIAVAVVLFVIGGPGTKKPIWSVSTLAPLSDDGAMRSLVIVENQGTTFIDANDLVSPLVIRSVEEGVELREASIMIKHEIESGFIVVPIDVVGPHRAYEIRFRNIDPHDYVIVEVAHTGRSSADIRVDGRMRAGRGYRQLRHDPNELAFARLQEANRIRAQKPTMTHEVLRQVRGTRSTGSGPIPVVPIESPSPTSAIASTPIPPSTRVLEALIANVPSAPIESEKETAARVREAMSKAAIFTLGKPAGDTTVPGFGTESDLLHFTIDDEAGIERVMLPVFTSPELMRDALLRNVDWQTLSVLQISGGALLQNVDPDVIIVVNPWTQLEFQIPPDSAPVPGRAPQTREPVHERSLTGPAETTGDKERERK